MKLYFELTKEKFSAISKSYLRHVKNKTAALALIFDYFTAIIYCTVDLTQQPLC